MGATIGPPIKPIRHLQIDCTLIRKDQTLWALRSDLKLKGCLHLFATLNGTLQKLIWISVSYTVRNKLKHTFFEVMCQDTDFSENYELKLEERSLEMFPRIG